MPVLTKSIPLLCLLSLFTLHSLLFSAPPLPDLIPDDASLVIIAHDIPTLVDRLQTSPWADTWNDDRVKKYLAPLREKIRYDEWPAIVRNNTGLTIDTLKTLVQGDILIALSPENASDSLTPQLGTTAPPILLAAELAPDATKKIQPLLTLLAATSTTDTPPPETYADATINTFKHTGSKNFYSPIYWSISQNTFLASYHRQLLIKALDAQQRGAAEHAFGKTKRYLAHHNTAPSLQFHLNLQTLLRLSPENTAPNTTDDSPPQLGIPTDTLTALGLDTINDLSITLTLAPDTTRITSALTYTEKRGLLALATTTDAPLKLPAYASADWPVFSVLNIDLPAFTDALQDLLADYNPALAAAIQSRLDDVNDTFSLNLKRDLIGALGTQLVEASVIPPGISPDAPNIADQLGTIYIAELRDPRTFQNTLAGLIRALGLDNAPAFTQRDYLGATIYALNNPRQPISIAIAKNQFILTTGTTTITETIAQNIIKGAPNPVTSDTAIRSAFDAAPSDIRYFTAQDMRITLRILATLLAQIPQARAYIAPDAIPPPSTFEKYWNNTYSWITEKSNGYYTTTEIPYKK